jgi:hypothetical protein
MTRQTLDEDMDGGRSLKRALVGFAIVEALVLIPIILYVIYR